MRDTYDERIVRGCVYTCADACGSSTPLGALPRCECKHVDPHPAFCFCPPQFWSSPGSSTLSGDLAFHGVLVARGHSGGQGLTMDGAAGVSRVLVGAHRLMQDAA